MEQYWQQFSGWYAQHPGPVRDGAMMGVMAMLALLMLLGGWHGAAGLLRLGKWVWSKLAGPSLYMPYADEDANAKLTALDRIKRSKELADTIIGNLHASGCELKRNGEILLVGDSGMALDLVSETLHMDYEPFATELTDRDKGRVFDAALKIAESLKKSPEEPAGVFYLSTDGKLLPRASNAVPVSKANMISPNDFGGKAFVASTDDPYVVDATTVKQDGKVSIGDTIHDDEGRPVGVAISSTDPNGYCQIKPLRLQDGHHRVEAVKREISLEEFREQCGLDRTKAALPAGLPKAAQREALLKILQEKKLEDPIVMYRDAHTAIVEALDRVYRFQWDSGTNVWITYGSYLFERPNLQGNDMESVRKRLEEKLGKHVAAGAILEMCGPVAVVQQDGKVCMYRHHQMSHDWTLLYSWSMASPPPGPNTPPGALESLRKSIDELPAALQKSLTEEKVARRLTQAQKREELTKISGYPASLLEENIGLSEAPGRKCLWKWFPAKGAWALLREWHEPDPVILETLKQQVEQLHQGQGRLLSVTDRPTAHVWCDGYDYFYEWDHGQQKAVGIFSCPAREQLEKDRATREEQDRKQRIEKLLTLIGKDGKTPYATYGRKPVAWYERDGKMVLVKWNDRKGEWEPDHVWELAKTVAQESAERARIVRDLQEAVKAGQDYRVWINTPLGLVVKDGQLTQHYLADGKWEQGLRWDLATQDELKAQKLEAARRATAHVLGEGFTISASRRDCVPGEKPSAAQERQTKLDRLKESQPPHVFFGWAVNEYREAGFRDNHKNALVKYEWDEKAREWVEVATVEKAPPSTVEERQAKLESLKASLPAHLRHSWSKTGYTEAAFTDTKHNAARLYAWNEQERAWKEV